MTQKEGWMKPGEPKPAAETIPIIQEGRGDRGIREAEQGAWEASVFHQFRAAVEEMARTVAGGAVAWVEETARPRKKSMKSCAPIPRRASA